MFSTWNYDSVQCWKELDTDKEEIPFTPENGISVCATVVGSWASHPQIYSLYMMQAISACYSHKKYRKNMLILVLDDFEYPDECPEDSEFSDDDEEEEQDGQEGEVQAKGTQRVLGESKGGRHLDGAVRPTRFQSPPARSDARQDLDDGGMFRHDDEDFYDVFDGGNDGPGHEG